MDYPTQLSLLRTFKFVSAFTYVSATAVGLWGEGTATRHRAVHFVASPALVATWFTGYLLASHRYIPLSEPWIVGGFAFSFVAQGALSSTSRKATVPLGARAVVVACLAVTVALMVFRPAWQVFS